MTVSVCIPTYNQAQYIETCVRSAYNQSFKPSEIIVSDDCSTDETQNILKNLKVEIPVLRIVRQDKNIGMVKNTDACLREGKGEFIVGLDSDDCLSDTYIERLSKLLALHSDACYAHANVQEIDQNGEPKQLRILYQKPGFQSAEKALHEARKGYKVAANIIMFRRSALVKLNYFTDRPDYVKDYHFAAATAAAGLGNVYVNETLAFYRVWVDTGKTRLFRKLNEINGLQKVFEEVLEPAYKKRGWSSSKLNNRKTNFACNHADCLGWNVYSKIEKMELTAALRHLSSSPRAKFFIWLHLNGYGKAVNIYKDILSQLRLNAKKLLLHTRT